MKLANSTEIKLADLIDFHDKYFDTNIDELTDQEVSRDESYLPVHFCLKEFAEKLEKDKGFAAKWGKK